IGTGRKSVVLVEGFFDCLKVWQAGFPAVALMGCSMSGPQELLLSTMFDAALLLFDGDEAGVAGIEAALTPLGSSMWVKAQWLPEGKQPDQMSSEELQEALEI